MSRAMEMLFEAVGDCIKIFILATIFVIAAQYTSLNIVAYQTVRDAERNGCFNQTVYNTNLGYVTFNTSEVVVQNVSPTWGTYVEKLGDPLSLTISKPYKVNFFGNELVFNITVHKDGINQGYYGSGY